MDKLEKERGDQISAIASTYNGLGKPGKQVARHVQQLKELQEKVKSLILANDDLKREMTTKESTLKALADQARDEKGQTEKQLYQTEFLVSEKSKEIERIKH